MADNSIALGSGGSYLFVGNSFTFGRVDPVMSYNTDNVRDLTSPAQGGTFTNTTGSNPYEPHPWGGVPGLFEAFASQAGLDLDVAISARNAATLQGQYLNSNPAGWDLRGNVASQAWDVVVLQDNSTQPLPSGSGSITFAAGSSTATLTIDPMADTKVETDETVGIQVTPSSTYRTSAGVVTGTILNDDPTGPTVNPANPTVTLVASPNAVAEDGAPNLVYTFTRTGPTTSALTVNFAAARDGGTAPSVTEYASSFQSNGSSTTGSLSFTSGTGSIVIKAGASSATFTIDPTPDSTVENDESVRLTLSANSNYNVGTQGAVSATILNDDFAPGTDLSLSNISVSIASSAAFEDGSGNLVYQFTRSGSNTAALTVNFSVSGTATLAGNDFTVSGANSFSTAGAADPNLQSFNTYAVKLAQYATTGAADAANNVPANTHANAATQVYLYETWARPNMVTGALVANTDDTTGAVTTTTTSAPEYYLTLEAMTADLRAAYEGLAAANPIFAGVAPVGAAFLAAVQDGTAMRNPYAPDAGKIDLWWDDNLHASKYGSYLSGLTMFGKLTGLDPRSLGAAEHVASDLGITQAVAAALQNVAAATLGFTLDAHWTAPGQVTELQGGVAGLLATEGSFGFSDSDVADTHTIAVAALTPGSVGTFSAAVHTDTTGDGTGGSVDWLFTVDNADVAFLAPGESRVEHFLVTISDANGGSAQRDVAVTLNGTYNDAPVATITPASYAVSENATLDLKNNGLSVSDIDGNSGIETATLTVGEGTLNITAGDSGAVVGGNGTSSVTIAGTIAQINALLGAGGTSTLAFVDNNDNPAATTTLTLLIDDNGNTGGGNLTATASATINITAVNDEPTLTATAVNPTFTEGGAAADIFTTPIVASTVDAGQTFASLTLTVSNVTDGANELFRINGVDIPLTNGSSANVGIGMVAVALSSGTATITLTGSALNASQFQTVIDAFAYSNTSQDPTASNRVVTITELVDSGSNTAPNDNTTALSITSTVNVVSVNDEPTLTATAVIPTFTEGGAAADIFTTPIAASTVEAGQNFTSMTLTVANVTSGASEILSFDGSNVALADGTTVTTATHGLDVSVSTSGTTATVTFSGASLAASDLQVLVDGLRYSNTSDDPSNADRVVTITQLVDSGPGASPNDNTTALNVTSTVHLVLVNDAPVATITPTSYAATENVILDLKNNGLAVSDVDGNAGSETVTLTVNEGTLTVTAGGSGAIVTSSGTSSVTIAGTVAQINALLNTDGTSTVSYTDGSDNPSVSTTLTLLIHDNGNTGGGDLSSSDTAIINITAVNDAPVATITPASYAVTENATIDLKNNGLSVSDIDGNAGSETVTLAVSDGILNVAAGTSGAGVANSGTGSVTITGTLAQINALLNTDGASGVSYVENDGNPGTTASLSLTIHDNGNTGGGDLSSTDTAILNITQVNDAPVATITPTSYAATENVGLDLKNNGLAVSDLDGNAGSETVTLSVTEGVLNVTAGGSGATVSNSGTNAVTITGTAAQIEALLNTDGTSTVGYIDNSDTPAASTMLTLLIHDNGNTGGGDRASSDTAVINIAAVNDAPVFTNLGGASHPTFVENGSAVVLDGNVTVSDPELNAAGNYGGATLTLARNGGANPDDTFAGSGTLDLAHSNGLGENVSLDSGTTFIGTFHQPGDGTFSITFNAGATAANVASVMQQIVYANASENPDASAQIDWSLSDGNTSAQGSGGAGAATGSVTVDITQVDDAPVLFNVAANAAYVPGTAGAVLSPTLGILDLDAVAPSPLQGLASATVKIDSGFFAGDELFVNLATSGGHFVTPDGDPTNISVQSNALGMLVLSGNDTVGHYQSVLDAVSYHSTAADPGNGGANPTRNISWQVNDGALNSQTPNPDPNNPVSETVLHFDTAPKVDLDASGAGTGFTTTFTENGAAIAIVDSDGSIVDPDDVNLDTATIVLTNAKPTDALSIAGGLPGGIDSSIDTSTPGQISLHLFNSASLADYRTALGQIRFVNSSDTPDTTDRDITVSVANGADSNVAHATIHVIAVDDAPVAASASAGGSEDTPISGIVSATDLDNTPSQLAYSLVGANGGAAHGAVVFHADGGYTYNPVHDFNGSDSFSFKANDGQLDSNVATVSLAVGAVNDAPVAANGSAGGNEDTPISGAVSASDVDNTPGQLSYALVGANGGAAHGTVAFNANGTFTYTPASNFNGSDSFSFKANDGALDSNVATESLTINAVDDAPVNTVPGPLNAQNGLDAAIIGLAVSDLDAVSLTTSLHVDHGMLSVAAVGGATVTGSGTGTVTLSGSVAQINAALGAPNNVLYQSAFDFAGTDHLTMTSNDGGSTGSGGPQTDTDVVDINAGHSAGAFLAFYILGSSDFHLH